MRLVFKGDVKRWTAFTLEDIRTLSPKTMHDGWLMAVFGSAPNDQDYWQIDKAAGPFGHVCAHQHRRPDPNRAAHRGEKDDRGFLRRSKLVLSDTWARRDSYRHLSEDCRTGVAEFKIADDEEIADPVQRLAEESEKQQVRRRTKTRAWTLPRATQIKEPSGQLQAGYSAFTKGSEESELAT